MSLIKDYFTKVSIISQLGECQMEPPFITLILYNFIFPKAA